MVQPLSHNTNREAHYEAALAAAMEDLSRAKVDVEAARQDVSHAEARVAELTNAVQALVALLPAERRAPYLQKIGTHPQANARTSALFDNVVQLFTESNRRDWTTPDVQVELEQRGVQAETKALYNVLGYLAKTGRLIRQGRGRYYVKELGFGIELADDIPGHGLGS